MFIELERLPEIRKEYQDQQIVMRAGCFDLLHEGHARALRFAKSFGDILVAGIWPDSRVRERKGEQRPIRSEVFRATLVGELKSVDFSIIMPEDDEENPSMIKVMKQLQPDIFVVAEAQQGHPNDRIIEQELGIRIVLDAAEPNDSTSRIINTVLERHAYEPTR
jgi:rfaE bifunctional protein nucleotidyltransferase chain/domain